MGVTADVMKSETKKREFISSCLWPNCLWPHWFSLIDSFKMFFSYWHQSFSSWYKCHYFCYIFLLASFWNVTTMSLFQLFSGFFFVFVCMCSCAWEWIFYLSMLSEQLPNLRCMPLPEAFLNNHSWCLAYWVWKVTVTLCVPASDCPCSPSLPLNLQWWETCCLRGVHWRLLSSFPCIDHAFSPHTLFCYIIILLVQRVQC